MDHGIKLPKVGVIPAIVHRLPGPKWIIKSATISQKSDGSYYISLLCEKEEHTADQRKDFLHNKSAAITKQYDYVVVEDLNMRSMANKGFGNGKATLENGYGMFLTMLEYKLHNKGGKLEKVDRWFPSSQLCNCCGFQNPEVKKLNIRTWTCPKCGSIHDRNLNAAVNIKDEGLRILRFAD